MTIEAYHQIRRIERITGWLTLAALIGAAILGWRTPAGAAAAWRLAVFACLQPALGSLIFVLIFALTGGQWLEGLAPFLHAGVRLLPWIWLLALPLLWFPIAAAPVERVDTASESSAAARPMESRVHGSAAQALERSFQAETSRHAGRALEAYFSRSMVAARAICYAVVFFLLAMGAGRVLSNAGAGAMRWFGPVGLIGLVFMLHLLAVDWLVMLDPGWYSTGFPLVWITGQALAGLAAAVAAALWFGADPAGRGGARRARGLDWGNLLLASVMSWTYVGFVQWLIIWSGNLPAETAWYRHRSHGAWLWVIAGIAALEFGAPFLLLLSRRIKQRRVALAGVSTLLVGGQFAYTVWIIVPGLPPIARGTPWLLCALVAAGAALFLNRYLAGARRYAAVLAA